MKVWTQHHDFSSDGDSTVSSVDEAAAILQNFDWESEITNEEEALATGEGFPDSDPDANEYTDLGADDVEDDPNSKADR